MTFHWHERAACRDHPDPDLWHPPGYSHGHESDILTALAVCATCPVKTACLEDALEREAPTYRWGIWGGTTPDQRTQLTRRKRRTRQ